MKTAKPLTGIVALGVLTALLSGCKQDGPLERAGEEIDEAANTIKNGGKETVGDKLDDTADDISDSIKAEQERLAREAKKAERR